MRKHRFAPAAVAGTLLFATAVPAGAQTDEVSGAGSSSTTLTALVADAGSLFSLDFLTDLGTVNTDADAGSRLAAAQVQALTVASDALGIAETVPVVAVSTTGDAQEANEEVTALDNPVVGGSVIPVVLRAAVDELGAAADATTGVTDLDILGGVLGVGNVDAGLDTISTTQGAAATHGITIDSLSALDLDSLLGGLGIGLADLSLDQVLGLVDGLGLLDQLGATLVDLGVDGLDLDNLSVAAITDTVAALDDDIVLLDSLEADLGLAEPVCEITDPAIDLLGQLIETDTSELCTDPVATLVDTADQLLALQSLLGDVLAAPLDLLAPVSLLSVQGIDVRVVTSATDDVATSVADVVASIGSIDAAGLALPGFDLGLVTAQITETLGTAQTAIGDVLATVDPRLADLVSVSVLDEVTSVTEDAGTVTASVDFTGLVVQVLPDVAELLAVIEDLGAVESVGDQLAGLGLPVPGLPTEIAEVNGLLAGLPTSGLVDTGAVYALSEGFTVEVASVSQTSSFTPTAAPAAPAPLPRTGSNDVLLLLVGGMAAAAALGIRRLAPARI